MTISATDLEFSVFLWAMALICSLVADVSSRDAACSDAPWESDWLEDATWPAAPATCWAPESSSFTACCNSRFTLRTMKNDIRLPTTMELSRSAHDNSRADREAAVTAAALASPDFRL